MFLYQLVYHDDSDELNDELDEMLLPVSDTDNEEWEQEESEGEENGVGPNESRVIDVEDSSDGEDVGEGGDNDQDQDMEDEQPIVNGVGSASEEEEMEDDWIKFLLFFHYSISVWYYIYGFVYNYCLW